MHGVSFLLLSSVLWVAVLGNTEIINFLVHEEPHLDIPQTKEWPKLHYEVNEGQWSVQPAPLYTPLERVCDSDESPCPHELWVTLDLSHEAWLQFSKFTLRLSWPASSPADFSIDLFNSQTLSDQYDASSPHHPNSSPPTTRLKYARIRVVDTGVLTPPRKRRPMPVTFILILEPLYFGILPATVVPILVFLVPVVICAGLMVPWINGYLDKIAMKAREEIAGLKDEGKDD